MPKVVDHEEQRRDILEKSLAVFSQHGYGEVSMRDIAAATGLSTGSIYHYFKGKEELFRALFVYLGDSTFREVVDDVCGIESGREKVIQLFDFFENRCARMQQQFLLSADLIRNRLGEEGDSILQGWAETMNRRLRVLYGLGEELSVTVFTFLAGSLYTSFLEPHADNRSRFAVFREMTLAYMQAHGISGNNRIITTGENND